MDFYNFNKDSTHPNPWKPPSRMDQFNCYRSNDYKIWKPDFEKIFMRPDPSKNIITHGPFGDRLATAAWRGFIGGLALSYVDVIFMSGAVTISGHLARFLYLTPPVMAVPVTYLVSKEALTSVTGKDGIFTYTFAAIPPSLLWGAFRNSAKATFLPFAFLASIGIWSKMNEESGGTFGYGFGEDGEDHKWEKAQMVDDWKQRKSSDLYGMFKDDEPFYKKWEKK